MVHYGKGGALETVIEGKTGAFFKEQTVASLKEAIEKFERLDTPWNSKKIRENAERFSKERFQKEFQEFVQESWQEFLIQKRT